MQEGQAHIIPKSKANVESMAEPTQRCHGHVKAVSAVAAKSIHHTRWMKHANGHSHRNDLWDEFNADLGIAILVTQGSDLQEILMLNSEQTSDRIDHSP